MATAYSIAYARGADAPLERFSDYLYARVGLAQSTVDLTLGFIRRMMAVTGPNPSVAEIDHYVANMRRAGASYANLSNALKAIEHFAAFLGTPVKFGRPRKPQKASISTLTEGKIAMIIGSAPTLRERAILSLLAYSGIRNRELINLRVRNVDVPQQTVFVEHGKGGNSRLAYVAGECMEILSDYLRERGGEPDDLLFVTARKRHQLQTQDIRKLVRKAAVRAGVNRRVWPHLFRHSLATLMLRHGASIYSIQAILGHAWVTTTVDYYLHPGRKTIQADYQKAVPSFL